MPLEQTLYSDLLQGKTNHIESSVNELSAHFHNKPEFVIGFLDGINEALDEQLDLSDFTEESTVTLDFGFDRLYKKMVEYRAEHLCELPEWDSIFDEDARHMMYKEQRASTTIRKESKIGRNVMCPCGSGKKYKNCCGAHKDIA